MSVRVPGCPHCVEPEGQPIVCDRCGWRWYANPKPAAAVLVERRAGGDRTDAEVLLLRRAVEPGAGWWDLPAGYLDPGESAEEAAIREAGEEAGLRVDLVRLVGVYASRPANAVTVVYLARQADPDDAVVTDHESSEHAWVTRAAVPAWLPRMAFRSMATALDDWAAGREALVRLGDAHEGGATG